jgi:hypothetical protein
LRGRPDDGAAAQIRQLEGGDTVSAVGRADELEQRLMIGNLQDLTRRLEVAAGHEIARERHDLPHHVDPTPALRRRENPTFADEVGNRLRGLIVVDEFRAAAKTCRELVARQRDAA